MWCVWCVCGVCGVCVCVGRERQTIYIPISGHRLELPFHLVVLWKYLCEKSSFVVIFILAGDLV